MYKVLVTGFEPFRNYSENSSWVVAEEVVRHPIEGVVISAEQMPVSFGRVEISLSNAVERHTPDLLILLGQSGDCDRIKLERTALNLMDAKFADNDLYLPDEEIIDNSGETALFTNLPIKRLYSSIAEQDVRVKISNSCGLYVCNRLYYAALKMVKDKSTIKVIFMHLTLYEGQTVINTGKATMPLSDMVKAVQTVIKEINDKDRRI